MTLHTRSHKQSLQRTISYLLLTIFAALFVIGLFYYFGFKCMTDEMQLNDQKTAAVAQERQRVLFRSCLDGMHFEPQKSADCEKLAQTLTASMNEAEKDFQK
jgi:hypothetical protein